MPFNPTLFIGAVLLFAVVAIVMLLAPMLIGWLVRPRIPDPIKDDIYECGEPTIGASTIQFDIRFYVVALLFIVFDVEIAFFFPWAVVFGKAKTLANPHLSEYQRRHVSAAIVDQPVSEATELVEPGAAKTFLWIAFFDLLVFFAVVLVAFFYLWGRGDLDWVRSVARQRATELHAGQPPPPSLERPLAV